MDTRFNRLVSLLVALRQPQKVANHCDSSGTNSTAISPPPSPSPHEHSNEKYLQWIQGYSRVENQVLGTLEMLLDQFDNLVMLQTFVPRLKDSRWGRVINIVLRQLSKIYLVVIAINLRKLVMRLIHVNKLIRRLELQCRIMRSTMPLDDDVFAIPKQLKQCLLRLYTIKIRTAFEIGGYVNELVLNIDILWHKRLRLPRRLRRVLNVIGWVVSLYRMTKGDDDDHQTEQYVRDMERNYM